MSDGRTGVYLDANAIIHLIEVHNEGVWPLLALVAQGELYLCTSELTLAEVLVKPFQTEALALMSLYERLLSADGVISTKSVTRQILVASARNRAELGNKGADAIHVTTAHLAECTVFASADKRIRLPAGLERWELDRLFAWAAK